MFSFLKNHPFAVEAFFESSLVITFAIDKEQVQHLIPPCLELDTFNNRWAFIAVAMVQTKDLRPKGFPAILGNDFFLVGYRIFVRYVNNAGKRLRGLYILQSETNKKKMELLGNIFTRYKYTTTDIRQEKQNDQLAISSMRSGFKIVIKNGENIPLPPASPFSDWKEARKFAGPLPFTFSYQPETNRVLIIEGVRKDWIPKPVHVLEHQFSFLEKMNLKDIRLANAFVIENIPYYWKKGRFEQWIPA
jgi:hypothetical protein